MKRIEKWRAEFGKFVKKLLLKRGGKGNIKGFELSLYNVVVALAPVIRLLRALWNNPQDGLTDAEWRLIFEKSRQMVRNVAVANRDRLRFEFLAFELKGIPSLLLHS